jgi:hypothetical protein
MSGGTDGADVHNGVGAVETINASYADNQVDYFGEFFAYTSGGPAHVMELPCKTAFSGDFVSGLRRGLVPKTSVDDAGGPEKQGWGYVLETWTD